MLICNPTAEKNAQIVSESKFYCKHVLVAATEFVCWIRFYNSLHHLAFILLVDGDTQILNRKYLSPFARANDICTNFEIDQGSLVSTPDTAAQNKTIKTKNT